MGSKAFGIIEALIAAGIITLVASGAVALNARVVQNTALLADRLIAFEWAQEGVEIMRQIRDSNLIDGDPTTKWDCFNPPSCTVAPDATVLYHPAASADGKRWTLVAGGQNNSFPALNLYTREIKVLPTQPADNEKRLIQVTVTFRFVGRTEKVTLATILTNWKRET